MRKQDGNAETVSSKNTAQARPDCAYAGFVSWVIKSTVMPSKGGDGACSHLISTSEAEFASMFIKLMDDADCRSLYGRLIFRKGNVFRRSEILSKYGAQMDRAISALVDIGLIDLPLMASNSATAEEISQDVIFARNGCSSNLARKQTLLALLQESRQELGGRPCLEMRSCKN